MKKMDIKLYGDNILRKESIDIKNIDSYIKELIDNMFYTMTRSNGIGLAAPQIGENINLFVVDLSPLEIDFKKVFINPKIISYSKVESTYKEGCLSVPGVSEIVYRPMRITIKYIDPMGEEQIEKLHDLEARVSQHEYDHLLGKLFIDYLSDENLKKYKDLLKRLEKQSRQKK